MFLFVCLFLIKRSWNSKVPSTAQKCKKSIGGRLVVFTSVSKMAVQGPKEWSIDASCAVYYSGCSDSDSRYVVALGYMKLERKQNKIKENAVLSQFRNANL